MDDPITLNKEEYEKLMKLREEAESTPAILIVSGSSRCSPADRAWDEVRDFLTELGKKYGYDPRTHGINQEREVESVSVE